MLNNIFQRRKGNILIACQQYNQWTSIRIPSQYKCKTYILCVCCALTILAKQPDLPKFLTIHSYTRQSCDWISEWDIIVLYIFNKVCRGIYGISIRNENTFSVFYFKIFTDLCKFASNTVEIQSFWASWLRRRFLYLNLFLPSASYLVQFLSTSCRWLADIYHLYLWFGSTSLPWNIYFEVVATFGEDLHRSTHIVPT